MSASRKTVRASRRPASRPVATAVVAALAAGSLAATAPAHAASSAPASSHQATSPSDRAKSAARRLNPTESASAQAEATGQPVTVDQLTGTGTQVVANPDGTFTRTDTSMPQRVQQQGKWVPIDTTLVRQPDGTWAPKAAVTHVAFSDGGSGALVTMRDGADKLGFSWPGALPKPVISKDTATYPEALPGVDLQLTADASGYSSILVVKTPKAAADPRLQSLTFNTTSANLKLAATANGGAQATDKRTGKTVFHSDTALMWDSTGQKTGARPSPAPRPSRPCGPSTPRRPRSASTVPRSM